MWELDHKEGWVPKNWCFQIVLLEKTQLRVPWTLSNEIKPVSPKENQPWIFIGRTVAEAGAPLLRPPDGKNAFTGKDPDAGKDWKQEKGTTEDEMVRWHLWLSAPEFEQILGIGEGQESLACCSPWTYRVGHNLGTEQQKLSSPMNHCCPESLSPYMGCAFHSVSYPWIITESGFCCSFDVTWEVYMEAIQMTEYSILDTSVPKWPSGHPATSKLLGSLFSSVKFSLLFSSQGNPSTRLQPPGQFGSFLTQGRACFCIYINWLTCPVKQWANYFLSSF